MNAHAIKADAHARKLALTCLDRTLLVEAGAGSGKTSVLAGRVVALMAAGKPPRSIAAITFTELAASELRERIERFTDAVLGDKIPADLALAFPNGLTVQQRMALLEARENFDELSCGTIHSFCQTLLTPFPVEADMDPGATLMDRDESDTLFAEVLDEMLRERLTTDANSTDALVAFFLADPEATQQLIAEVAGRMRSRPDIRAPIAAVDARDAVRKSIAKFRRFIEGAPCREPDTVAIIEDLERAVEGIARTKAISPADVLHVLTIPVPATCATAGGAFKSYRAKGKWQSALKATKSKAEANRLNDQAAACYDDCKEAFAALKSWAAAWALGAIEPECRTIVARFTLRKREAALLDFDDLMLKARDLLRERSDVRAKLAGRFSSILVDEFQDTDSLQVELLWRLAATPPEHAETTSWTNWPVKPGSLFLVGDPKQAIYRFRGADVASYQTVRERLRAADPSSIIAITQNFRSVPGILDWVNTHFETPLKADGQPGFAPLFAALPAIGEERPVVALPVTTGSASASEIRDAEAEAVADLCATLIANRSITERSGALRPCTASDIALLAPGGTELWRYERALEERGINVSTQAGKGFFRRQEVHDLIALTRTLADRRDRLALGALLRGPLIGLTEEQLLDATAEIAAGSTESTARLDLWTPPDSVSLPLLRETLSILQGLARRADTTPYILLCAAVEELRIRPVVRRRRARTAERALGNIDLFLELARPYGVRGLQAFAAQMRRQWQTATRSVEARGDNARPAVSLITMHSAKGLEWPIVIPINTATAVMDRAAFAIDEATSTFHARAFGHYPDGATAALDSERDERARERYRIWYVAATRARELLVLPRVSADVQTRWWVSLVSAGVSVAEPFALLTAVPSVLAAEADGVGPDAATFATQAVAIRTNAKQLVRITPHLAEAEKIFADEQNAALDENADIVASPTVRGSRARGLILHKLMEEVLTGEVEDGLTRLTERAASLKCHLDDGDPGDPDPSEMAHSILRGLALPEVAAVRADLVPECWITSHKLSTSAEEIALGIADAVALDSTGNPTLIIDWKSDVSPSADIVAHYRVQVRSYLHACDAPAGMIVFLTSGSIEYVPRSLSN